MNMKFKIKGLDCANCANELENVLQKIDGIKDLSISYMSERLFFSCLEEDKEIEKKKIEGVTKVSISFMTERMEIEYESSEEEIIKKIQKVIKREEPDVSIDKI